MRVLATAALATCLLTAAPPEEGWKAVAPPRVFEASNLYGHIDGGAELFLEYGFRRLEVRYHHKGARELGVELYRMESPEAALGIYLSRCGQETPLPGLAERHSATPHQLTVLCGPVLLLVLNPGGDPALLPDMGALARRCLEGVPREKPRDLLALLPREGQVPGSAQLIRGPYGLQPFITLGEGDPLELQGRRFAAVADYKDAKGRTFSRLRADYGSPAEAAALFRRLCAGLDPSMARLRQEAEALAFKDFQGRFGRIRVEGGVLDLVWNLEEDTAL